MVWVKQDRMRKWHLFAAAAPVAACGQTLGALEYLKMCDFGEPAKNRQCAKCKRINQNRKL